MFFCFVCVCVFLGFWWLFALVVFRFCGFECFCGFGGFANAVLLQVVNCSCAACGGLLYTSFK